MKSEDRPQAHERRVLMPAKFALSFVLPVALNSALSLVAPYQMVPVALVCSVIGFLFLRRGNGPAESLLIGLGYFPMIILILLFSAMAGVTAFRMRI